MNTYPKLFSPIKIGETTVKNRVFMPPISTNLADKGYVTDALVEHYAARAKGGVGLIVTEVTTVEPTYVYLPGDMSICDDSYIPGWEKLTAAVHKYGAKILPQLFHPAYMAFPIPGTPRLIAPSFVGPYYAKEAPRPVTVEELQVIIRQFGEAALRVKKAGADGVEIHAAHAHGLLGGFLSPLYNKRIDAYGGDINGRLKLTLEVIAEVRKICGKDFIIDVRISGDEYSDGGLNLNDAIYVSKQLEKAGVDMLHVSGGTTIKRGSSIPAPGTKMGSHSALSAEIKKHVSIPVATVGRITEPWLAEELLENDKADICMIGRANLCEPEFCNKAQAGHEEDIRPCIGCLRCLNGIMFGKRVACTVNPSLEPENEDTITPAKETKNVLVIGGGPAGMEAAYVAAKRGHHVVVFEKEKKAGGQLNLACRAPFKQEISKWIVYLLQECDRYGAEIRYEIEVNADVIKAENPDIVILATGAEPIVLPVEGKETMIQANDVLSGKVPILGGNAAIIGGGMVGIETAEYVLHHSRGAARAALIEMTDSIGQGMVPNNLVPTMARLRQENVQMITGARVKKIDAGTIIADTKKGEMKYPGFTHVICAVGSKAWNPLYEEIKDTYETYVIGDAKEVAQALEAVRGAYELGYRL